MLRWWTIGRATGVGVSAGLAALVLWPLYAAYQERVLWAFLAALAVAAICGVSILAISAADAVLKPRGRNLRPIRAFDIAVGLLLAGPSLLQLEALLS
jgi:drug/metabolite transporter (DMT)-like permease